MLGSTPPSEKDDTEDDRLRDKRLKGRFGVEGSGVDATVVVVVDAAGVSYSEDARELVPRPRDGTEASRRGGIGGSPESSQGAFHAEMGRDASNDLDVTSLERRTDL